MDFARKQLEKYGWSDGKGLGKHENGIAEALKPKIKRSVTGVGHDPASEFNEHWWSALYDKASKNVEVEEKNGKTKKIKTKDSDNFIITSSTWKMNKKSSSADETEYSEYFVRTAVLTNDKGGRKTENVKSESEDEVEQKDVFKMTDEELFAACEGRTAHKGARHGLRSIGKLARIAQQEEILLTQPQYQSYTHAKKLRQNVEQMNLEDIVSNVHKKKKKRKHCNKSSEMAESCSLPDNPKLAESDITLPIKVKSKNRDVCENYKDVQKNKNKKGNNNKNKEVELDSSVPETVECENELSVGLNTNEDGTVKKPKKRRVHDMQTDSVSVNCDGLESKIKKKNKRKSKND